MLILLLCLDVEKRKSPACGFVTPLEGSEADSHRKPEVSGIKAGIFFNYTSNQKKNIRGNFTQKIFFYLNVFAAHPHADGESVS